MFLSCPSRRSTAARSSATSASSTRKCMYTCCSCALLAEYASDDGLLINAADGLRVSAAAGLLRAAAGPGLLQAATSTDIRAGEVRSGNVISSELSANAVPNIGWLPDEPSGAAVLVAAAAAAVKGDAMMEGARRSARDEGDSSEGVDDELDRVGGEMLMESPANID